MFQKLEHHKDDNPIGYAGRLKRIKGAMVRELVLTEEGKRLFQGISKIYIKVQLDVKKTRK